MQIVISGTGLYTPKEGISNLELVTSFNEYVRQFNDARQNDIASGKMEPLQESSVEFIEKASGIKHRYVMNKEGILDPKLMRPNLTERPNEQMSLQCEMAFFAAKQAMQEANKTGNDIDFVIVACSNMQRPYPAIAIELQQALQIDGYAYDLNVACSSATFGIQTAVNAIKAGSAKAVLIVNPEICSGHLNFRDRNSHFIFGDAGTAIVVEAADTATADCQYEIVDCKLKTLFSSNVRNNGGFLSRCTPESRDNADKLFVQDGKKVFKEVTPLVANLILEHLEKNHIKPNDLTRLWLHQANSNMNRLIGTKLLGHEPSTEEAPIILDEYANTSSAGSVIAFHKTCKDLAKGSIGILCSFGAGYSAGNIILKKIF